MSKSLGGVFFYENRISIITDGGAKGIVHVWIIEALKDYGINIDNIAGTSSWSLVASLYAAGYTPNEILRIVNSNTKKILDYDKTIGFKLFKTIFNHKISIRGFIKGEKFENLLRFYLKKKNIKCIKDIKFPLAIPVVNVKNGQIVYYTNSNINDLKNVCGTLSYYGKYYDDVPLCNNNGDLAEIVRASCSFPGVFVPKIIGNNEYIDGGVRVNTPVKILKEMGADKVIAVSFNCNSNPNSQITNIIDISEQAMNILSHSLSNVEQNLADVNIRACMEDISLLDFSKATVAAKRGYNIVASNITFIKKKLGI